MTGSALLDLALIVLLVAYGYSGYRHHYVVYYPSYPTYTYYYNPYRRVYWGRYDFEKKGYSLLAPEDRKKKLADIPADAFPEPGQMPTIPEADDDVRMLPPDDLPDAELAAPAAQAS